jgi:hypothetical protein
MSFKNINISLILKGFSSLFNYFSNPILRFRKIIIKIWQIAFNSETKKSFKN